MGADAPFRSVVVVVLCSSVLGSVGCASSVQTAAEPPLDAAACSKLADGIGPDGRSTMVESFDSLFALLQKGQKCDTDGPAGRRLDRKPSLLSRQGAGALLQRHYPQALLREGRGGRTMVAFLIRADGTADRVRIVRSSNILELDAATVRAVGEFRFSPGVYRGCPVTIFAAMPVTWDPRRQPTANLFASPSERLFP